MPKRQRRAPLDRYAGGKPARGWRTIRGYLKSKHCVLCDAMCKDSDVICEECRTEPAAAHLTLHARERAMEAAAEAFSLHCAACAGASRTHGTQFGSAEWQVGRSPTFPIWQVPLTHLSNMAGRVPLHRLSSPLHAAQARAAARQRARSPRPGTSGGRPP